MERDEERGRERERDGTRGRERGMERGGERERDGERRRERGMEREGERGMQKQRERGIGERGREREGWERGVLGEVRNLMREALRLRKGGQFCFCLFFFHVVGVRRSDPSDPQFLPK
jgi:hypothetical protein